MKLFSHLQLALLLLFVTDITVFDNKPLKSKILTEGFFIKQKSTLQERPPEKEVCKKKTSSPLKLAACAMRHKSCGGERSSGEAKELTECPFCGNSICPQQQQQQQQQQHPPQRQQQNQQKKPGCPNQKNSCPQQKTSCPQARPKCPSAASKPKCPASPKSKCPQPTRPSCPPPEKTTCPYEKPPSPCPERCSMFRKFSFPAVMNIKYPTGATVKIEHKSDKCPPKCPGGANCKGKPVK